jgi:hypothetical protein
MPVVLATQDADIRKIAVQSQPGQIVRETIARKIPFSSIGPEFKPQSHQKKKKRKKNQVRRREVSYWKFGASFQVGS